MTYALSRAGLAFGIAMMLFFAFITDFSLRILVESGRITGANSYQGVVYAAFGIPGYIILTLLQFIYPVVGKVFQSFFFYLRLSSVKTKRTTVKFSVEYYFLKNT